MARDPKTGVCVMRLTAGLDSGPVALRAEVELGEDEDYGALAPRLAALGGDLLVEALDLLADGTLAFTEQDEAAVTYAEKITAEERRLDPAEPAADLAAKVRALTPHIGAYLELEGGERLGVRKARAVDAMPVAEDAVDSPPAAPAPGEAVAAGGELFVGTGEGLLRLDVVQPPGGKADAGRRLSARPSGAEARVRASAGSGAAGARLRGPAGDLRARRPHRARLPRGRRAARPRRPRPGAGPAAHLRLGPAQRHLRRGDREALRPRDPPPRPARRRVPAPRPLRAALRRRDPRPRRRRPGGGAGEDRQGTPTRPASSTRSCAAPRASGSP